MLSRYSMKKSEKKRKLPVWAWILIVIGIVAVLTAAAIFGLAYGLLDRITRPDDVINATLEPTVTDVLETPAPTPEPDADVTAPPVQQPTPEPTPDGPLPLEDVVQQTHLSADILETMDKYNRTSAQFTNILLVGADRRGSSGGANADVMMIATVDKKHGALKLTTIMRDMLVDLDVEGQGYGKLNSADSLGGYDALMSTINNSFHLNITEYVMVDFTMFESIVDKLEGVTVKMTAEEISAANDCIAGLNKERGVEYLWDGFIFAEAGNVKLTGKQALGFARVRHIDSDFSRTQRQFMILNAIYAKFRSMSLAKQYQALYDLLPLVETNMTSERILKVGVIALGMNADGLLPPHTRGWAL